MIADRYAGGALRYSIYAAIVGATLVGLMQANAEPATTQDTNSSGNPAAAPVIVNTSPAIGATDVDPATTSITVTFDRDMGTGMSWTGGGPTFPPILEGAKAQWKDLRTCVLPVKLQPAAYYRVGINSTSFRNFRAKSGTPADTSAIYFTTQGASEELTARVRKPAIVSITPAQNATDVDPATTSIVVMFDTPMGEGFSWTGAGPHYPTIPEGQRPIWSSDHKSCTLPVKLQANWDYALGLNSPSYKNFQSAAGIPLDPVQLTFKTKP